MYTIPSVKFGDRLTSQDDGALGDKPCLGSCSAANWLSIGKLC